MSLVLVNTGDTIAATHINQFTNVLQRSSGQTEVGKYFLENGLYATNAYMSTYYNTKSQGATPVSVSIDTADQAATGCNAPTTAQLTQYGFQVKASATGVGTDVRVGGNWTVTY